MGLPRESEHMHLGRPKEEAAEDDTANRIARLGPFDRAIVLLWLENMSYEEIGKVVGISTKNVSVRLFRIKEQLKNMSEE